MTLLLENWDDRKKRTYFEGYTSCQLLRSEIIGWLPQHSNATLNSGMKDLPFSKPNFYDAAYLEWLQALLEQVLVTGFTQTPA